MFAPTEPTSDNLTASSSTVWTDWTRTGPLEHLGYADQESVRASEKRRMESGTERHQDQISLPADCAVSSVLSAH